jgi:hypothetical protein
MSIYQSTRLKKEKFILLYSRGSKKEIYGTKINDCSTVTIGVTAQKQLSLVFNVETTIQVVTRANCIIVII